MSIDSRFDMLMAIYHGGFWGLGPLRRSGRSGPANSCRRSRAIGDRPGGRLGPIAFFSYGEWVYPIGVFWPKTPAMWCLFLKRRRGRLVRVPNRPFGPIGPFGPDPRGRTPFFGFLAKKGGVSGVRHHLRWCLFWRNSLSKGDFSAFGRKKHRGPHFSSKSGGHSA